MDIKITDKLFEQVSPTIQQQLLVQAQTAFDVELNGISDKKKKAEFFDTKQIKFINDYISKELPSKIIKLKKIQAKNAEKAEIARLKQEADSRMIKLTQEEADKILSTKHWNLVYKNANAVKAESRKRAQKRFDKEVSKKEAGENIKSALVSNPFIKRVLDNHAKKEKAYDNRQKHKDNKLKTKKEAKDNRKKKVSAFKGKVVKKLNKNPFGKLLVKIGGVLTKVLSSWLAKLSVGLMIMKFIFSPMGMMIIAFISAWVKHKIIKPVMKFVDPIMIGVNTIINFVTTFWKYYKKIYAWVWKGYVKMWNFIFKLPEKIKEFFNMISDYWAGIITKTKDWFTDKTDAIKDFFAELPDTISALITGAIGDLLGKFGNLVGKVPGLGKLGDFIKEKARKFKEKQQEKKDKKARRKDIIVSESEKGLDKYGPNQTVAKFRERKAKLLKNLSETDMSRQDRKDRTEELNELFERQSKNISYQIDRQNEQFTADRNAWKNFTTNNNNITTIIANDEPTVESPVGGFSGDGDW